MQCKNCQIRLTGLYMGNELCIDCFTIYTLLVEPEDKPDDLPAIFARNKRGNVIDRAMRQRMSGVRHDYWDGNGLSQVINYDSADIE